MSSPLKRKKIKLPTAKSRAKGGGDISRKVKIKAHSRSPRGPDRGKSRVRVRRHSRRSPRR